MTPREIAPLILGPPGSEVSLSFIDPSEGREVTESGRSALPVVRPVYAFKLMRTFVET
jgi:hypothetical protein